MSKRTATDLAGFRNHLFLFGILTVLLVPSCELVQSALSGYLTGGFASGLLRPALKNYDEETTRKIDTLLANFSGIGKPPGSTGSALARGSEPPIMMDIALLKQTRDPDGRLGLEPIEDEDVLRDSMEEDRAGDRFRITLQVNQDCYMYIVNIDATGWATPLFPIEQSAHRNPLSKDTLYQFPNEEYAFALDDVRGHDGIEHIYFMASRQALPDIEAVVQKIEEKEHLSPRSIERVEETVLIERGVDEIIEKAKEFVIKKASGEVENFALTRFKSDEPAEDQMVITRWFWHK